MATEKNITMKQFNGTDYDTLYPKTKVEQVEDAYSQQQILADSTKGLYGLDSGAVPDDVLALLKTLVNAAQERANISPKFEIGSYQGAYNSRERCSKTIYFSGKPQIVIIIANGGNGLNPHSYGGWDGYSAIILRGSSGFSKTGNQITVSFSDNAITIGPGDAQDVFNYNGYTYTYFALCT